MQQGKKDGGRNPSGGFGYGFATSQDPAWSLEQVLAATAGTLLNGKPHTYFRNISTDSRTIEVGDLFVGLPGDKFDGNAFALDAVRKGAAGVVVTSPPIGDMPVAVILVDDSLAAFGELARYRRHLMKDLTVLAITGSSGKTTVKEMTSAILGQEFAVLKTKGNFNNLVGLPLSLLPVDCRHRLAVLEMGMNKPGEIARLTAIADPDIACIVNIQSAHLAGFADIDGVARAKGELFAGCRPDTILAVNLEDPRVAALASRQTQKKISFGFGGEAEVRASQIVSLGENGMSFTLHLGDKQERITIRGLGTHNVLNSLAAASLAYGAGLDISMIAAGLSAFVPFAKRLQIEKMANGLNIVNDSYNANPASMLAALETVQDMNSSSRKVAVLGDMMELGNQSMAAHQFIGESTARLGFDLLLAVGNFGPSVIEAANKAGMAVKNTRVFDKKDEIAPFLDKLLAQGELATGDWILVKGSRSMQMETIIAELAALAGGDK